MAFARPKPVSTRRHHPPLLCLLPPPFPFWLGGQTHLICPACGGPTSPMSWMAMVSTSRMIARRSAPLTPRVGRSPSPFTMNGLDSRTEFHSASAAGDSRLPRSRRAWYPLCARRARPSWRSTSRASPAPRPRSPAPVRAVHRLSSQPSTLAVGLRAEYINIDFDSIWGRFTAFGAISSHFPCGPQLCA